MCVLCVSVCVPRQHSPNEGNRSFRIYFHRADESTQENLLCVKPTFGYCIWTFFFSFGLLLFSPLVVSFRSLCVCALEPEPDPSAFRP